MDIQLQHKHPLQDMQTSHLRESAYEHQFQHNSDNFCQHAFSKPPCWSYLSNQQMLQLLLLMMLKLAAQASSALLCYFCCRSIVLCLEMRSVLCFLSHPSLRCGLLSCGITLMIGYQRRCCLVTSEA